MERERERPSSQMVIFNLNQLIIMNGILQTDSERLEWDTECNDTVSLTEIMEHHIIFLSISLATIKLQLKTL